ncbi:hypothetical protein B0H13DRAFT_2369731 [Mycena leptocephala]|nr:hypothetical protein B0H13DRAFT_2369731 [Mycena leptocephala]
MNTTHLILIQQRYNLREEDLVARGVHLLLIGIIETTISRGSPFNSGSGFWFWFWFILVLVTVYDTTDADESHARTHARTHAHRDSPSAHALYSVLFPFQRCSVGAGVDNLDFGLRSLLAPFPGARMHTVSCLFPLLFLRRSSLWVWALFSLRGCMWTPETPEMPISPLHYHYLFHTNTAQVRD